MGKDREIEGVNKWSDPYTTKKG